MTAVSDGALDSAKEAVTLCITMLGVMSLWTGLMEIANRSGLIDKCTKAILPLMQWLFPGVPKDHDAMQRYYQAGDFRVFEKVALRKETE